MADFYQSTEWKALRKKAFKRYGHRCHATGLTEKDGITLSIDHIKPRSKYPHLALKLSNVQVLELGLNKTKGARIVKDWRPLKWKAYYIILRVLKTSLLVIALSFACAALLNHLDLVSVASLDLSSLSSLLGSLP